MAKKLFDASMFTATAHSTTADKAKFANHFVRFVESDFKPTLFYGWFYTRLSMTFGHIAHYNCRGFYETFFADLAGKVRFLEITAGVKGYDMICGAPTHTYSDVERELRSWVQTEGVVEKARAKLGTAVEKREREILAGLKAKYELAPA